MLFPAQCRAVDEAGGVDAEAVHVQHGDEEGEGLQNSERAVDEDEVPVRALGRRLVGAASKLLLCHVRIFLREEY